MTNLECDAAASSASRPKRQKYDAQLRLNLRALGLASLLTATIAFASVHAMMNAPMSKEQRFVNDCRQLKGVVIRNPDGKVMDNKLICLRKEALLGWQSHE